jgi:peptidoglycan hydrolase-like protein with peptidoglycan-binding domain
MDAVTAFALMLPADDTTATIAAPTMAEVYSGQAKLRLGMSGPAIETLQTELSGVGKTAEVTGVFDEQTKIAYKSWQKKFGYWPTGVVTGKQATYLKKLYGKGTLPKICRTGQVLCVDKTQLLLRAMKDGEQELVTDVRFGSSETPTRNGKFAVYSKVKYLVSDLSGTPMPYSLFFSGGQAVHYSPGFNRDGYNGSSLGCVNVRSLKNARWLFQNVPTGTTVYIYRS